jgi:hypothetical protein
MNWNAIIVNPWISGLTSGLLVAIFNFILSKRKVNAEIKKMEAETLKIQLEASKINKELLSNIEGFASATYNLPKASEWIIYDSAKSKAIGYDFKGKEGKLYNQHNKAISDFGTGTLDIENDVLILRRTNTIGRFELWLQTYIWKNQQTQFLPKNELLEGKKRIRVSFEIMTNGVEHTLRFVFKSIESENWMGHTERKFKENIWVPVNLYFLISPKENCQLRIDDMDINSAPSSIRIRNFILAEMNL